MIEILLFSWFVIEVFNANSSQEASCWKLLDILISLNLIPISGYLVYLLRNQKNVYAARVFSPICGLVPCACNVTFPVLFSN